MLSDEKITHLRWLVQQARQGLPFAHPDGKGGVAVEPPSCYVLADDLSEVLDEVSRLRADYQSAGRHVGFVTCLEIDVIAAEWQAKCEKAEGKAADLLLNAKEWQESRNFWEARAQEHAAAREDALREVMRLTAELQKRGGA